MIFILIKWKIKNTEEMINSFLDHWKKEAVIQDRKGLVGEFLSEIESNEKYDYITWDIEEPKSDTCKTFINVGIWENGEVFREQIGQYFDNERPLEKFEAERRVRTVLKPKCWRVGDASFSKYDSGGVL